MLVVLYVCCTDSAGERADSSAHAHVKLPRVARAQLTSFSGWQHECCDERRRRHDGRSTLGVMAPRAAVLNTITTAGRIMLLTQTGGVAIHLTASANGNDDPQPAIPSRIRQSSPTDDTFTDLTDRCWAPQTLCGIRWNTMAGIASTGASNDSDRTPTCRRCLAILDRWFPEPVPDDRIGLLAELASDAVHQYGTAEIVGVPGDQHTALRRAIRAELKEQYGHSAKTFVIDDRVVISSNDTTEALQAEAARQFHEAFSSADAVAIDDSAWRFHWRTWSTT